MELGLEGRSYVVTGGSAGIGRAVVECLLDEGACVATCARDGHRLADVWEGHRFADRLVTVAGDVRDQHDMDDLVAAASAAFGRVDGAVANGGAGTSGGFVDTSNDVFLDQISVKLLGLANLVRAVLSPMQAAGVGRIVVVNGVTARLSDPEMVAVGAARAAVESLARSLAVELAPWDIAVTWVNPGPIDTDRQRNRHALTGTTMSYSEWKQAEATRRGVPLRRFGTSAEVANVICFLLSPRASFVTGSGIDVAGGLGAASPRPSV